MSSPPTAATTAVLLRPWSHLVGPISIPISLSDATHRLSVNLKHFFPNYTFIVLLITLLTLITRPLTLLLFLGISAAWIYIFLSDDPLTVLDREIEKKWLVGFLGVLTLVALLWTNVWGNVFLGLIVGCLVVVVHGVFRGTDEGFGDDSSPYGNLINVVDGDDEESTMGEYARV